MSPLFVTAISIGLQLVSFQLARDPYLFRTFGKTWYGQNPNLTSYPSFPQKILLSSGFASVSAPAAAIYSDFFSKLADLLGATTQNVSIVALWNQTSGQSMPITTMLNAVCDLATNYLYPYDNSPIH